MRRACPLLVLGRYSFSIGLWRQDSFSSIAPHRNNASYSISRSKLLGDEEQEEEEWVPPHERRRQRLELLRERTLKKLDERGSMGSLAIRDKLEEIGAWCDVLY